MPCIPLIISSACFVIPAVIGLRKKKVLAAAASSLLATTSLWFHGTYGRLAYMIDRAYAHVFAMYYIAKATRNILVYRRAIDTFAFGCIVGTLTCYGAECRHHDLFIHVPFHVGVHMFSIGALVSHMLDEGIGKSPLTWKKTIDGCAHTPNITTPTVKEA